MTHTRYETSTPLIDTFVFYANGQEQDVGLALGEVGARGCLLVEAYLTEVGGGVGKRNPPWRRLEKLLSTAR
jgi:hypothetical protein